MIAPLTPRDRGTLTLGALVVAAIVVAGRGLPALRRWESQQVAAAREVREQLAIARAASGSFNELADSAVARTRREAALRDRHLRGPSVEAATAAFAAHAERLAADQTVDVLSVALKPDSAGKSAYRRVQVRVSAEGDVAGLSDFLYTLESNAIPAAIREVIVSPNDVFAPANRMEQLRFDVVVETLARITPPATRGPAR